MPPTRLLQAALFCCIWLSITIPAAADEAAEVPKLMRNGQYAEAMSRVDAALAQKPSDPRLRFSKGMLLAQQNKPTEAITVLLKLTEDFPDLPEPYNNLAVLYAGNGQYESARIALDKAIANNPSYATAYENLGDVYAELARQAYEKSVKLDTANAGAKAKMTRLGVSTPAIAQAEQAKATTVALNAQPTPTVVKPAAPASVDKSATPAVVGKPGQDEILTAVHAWARAWSERDMKTYLGFYSEDFHLPRGMSRDAWVQERTARITGKKRISVAIEIPEVKLEGETATVRFRQQFSSDKLNSTDWKTLVLIKRNGQWQIREERSS
jgi:Flp pilus assembly protein TadD/ketosteroid isomerase-like protein